MQRLIGIGIALWSLTAAAPLRAIETFENEAGDVSFSLVGAERLTGAFFHVPSLDNIYPSGDDALVASVTRLILEGMVGEHLKLELNGFIDLSRQPFAAGGGTFATAASFESPYRTPYLLGDIWHDGSVRGQGGVDRLSAALTFEPVTITIGRAPLNYSVTQIFAPNDFFAPFSATAINTVYKPGVDAITVGVAPGMLSLIELSAVLGNGDDDAPSFGESALLLHAQTVVQEVELALMGGKLAERWIAGASVQAAAGRFNIRGEGHVGFPDTDGDFSMDDIDGDGRTWDGFHARLAVTIDTFFSWHNSSLGLGYLYLSDGAARPGLYLERAARFFPDDLPYLGRHYLALSLATEIIPVLRAALTGLVNAEDPSGVAVASLVYNLSDEADFVAGAMIPMGKRPESAAATEPFEPKSEYGHTPLGIFLESRFYF